MSRALLALIVVLGAGCDAFVSRRILVATDPSQEARLLATVRGYAAAMRLECRQSGADLLECQRPPRRILVVHDERVYAVRLFFVGAPFEVSKFEDEAHRLAGAIAAEFGDARVSVQGADGR